MRAAACAAWALSAACQQSAAATPADKPSPSSGAQPSLDIAQTANATSASAAGTGSTGMSTLAATGAPATTHGPSAGAPATASLTATAGGAAEAPRSAAAGSSSDGVVPPGADQDADGIDDAHDNCPARANPEQGDANGDGLGDACMCDMPIVKCESGMAGPYPCSGVDMLGRVSFADMGGRSGNAVWGGVIDGREIGVAGLDNGTAFVDVSIPNCPVVLGFLPSTSGRNGTRDVKVYGHYALAVAEIQNHGLQIFDMSKLPARSDAAGASNMVKPTLTYKGANVAIGVSHNVVVNEASNMVYLAGDAGCNRSVHMVDFSDPMNPKSLGCIKLPGQVHDAQCLVYHGPDTTYAGHELCITYNGNDSLSVVDVQDKSAVKVVSTASYKGGVYSHQGWFNEAHTHIALGDELDEGQNRNPTRTFIFDMTDLDKPMFIGQYDATTKATDHNEYIVGNFLYQANYQAGLRILDVSQLPQGKLKETGFFDTMPNADGADMYGAWTAYPFFKSGIVLVQTQDSGLYILKPQRSALTSAPARD